MQPPVPFTVAYPISISACTVPRLFLPGVCWPWLACPSSGMLTLYLAPSLGWTKILLPGTVTLWVLNRPFWGSLDMQERWFTLRGTEARANKAPAPHHAAHSLPIPRSASSSRTSPSSTLVLLQREIYSPGHFLTRLLQTVNWGIL